MNRGRRIPFLVLLACLILFLPGCSRRGGEKNAPMGASPMTTAERVAPDARFDAVRAKIIRLVEKEGIASLSVAVAEGGRIAWMEAFGWADREQGRAATSATMYSLASITKPMTSTGVMILVERGQIDLDEPLNTYLGEAKLRAFEGRISQATVKRVLRHTAGLPIHWNYFYEDDPFQPPDMEETIRRYGILVTVPGEVYQYSNLGYGILGHVISRVSGQSYAQFMRSEVFRPLGMNQTSVGLAEGMEGRAAVRYWPSQKPVPFYDFDHPGASAVFSSARDLIRFAMFHLKWHLPDQGRILTDAGIELMQNDEDREYPGKEYRLGFRVIEKEYGYRTVSHTGAMEGVSTELKMIPSEDIALVVLSNSRDRRVHELDNEILAAMLPLYAENFRKRDAGSGEAGVETFTPSSELAGEWEGEIRTYGGIQPVRMRFDKGGPVFVKLEDREETPLENARFEAGFLTGRFNGEIKTPDAARLSHFIELKVKLYPGGRMSGYANANSGRWFSLGSFIILKKIRSDEDMTGAK